MTNNKANKSKILALILGLTMCIVLMLGIVLANPADTARAEETDTRTVVSTITASSDVDTIIGFGNRVVRPSFNIKEDVPAQFQTQYNWKKKTAAGGWESYTNATFMEGTYRYVTQIRIDSDSGGGTTHVLDKNGITVTVNGKKWDNSTPEIYAEYSFAWVESEEYPVTAPAGTPLYFVKDKKWDIDRHYINQAITAFSVAEGVAGGTKPYAFSKVSGPEWIDVAADGTVSGMPTAVGANADLVIKVTDSATEPASKEITLDVGNTYVLPEDREVISVIRATSNIGEILGYGKRVVKPSFTFTEGTQANFPYVMGHWYKKEGTAWKRYEEATFTEGIYRYSNQLRVDDEYGMTHVLNKDGVSVYIDDKLCVDNQKPKIDDTYSLTYVDTAEHEVVKEVNDELVSVTDLEKVYNETAQEPTFGGTLVRDTDYEVSYAVKAGSTGVTIGGIPVDAGTYVVTVTGKGAYSGSFTKEFVIDKKEQSAPSASLFTTVAPTSETSTDGKITGITDKMEYRKVGETAWTMGTGSDVTGLSSGKYQIRFKETDNYKAGAVTEVEVPESGVSSYNLTVNGGTGGGEFEEGASVTITANEPTIGKKFSGWTIDGITGLDTTQTSITFNMPAGNVTATANYEDIEYTVTVNGGTADKTKAIYGESVTITANAPTTGQRFAGWTIEGISGLDTTKTSLTFNMPAGNVTAFANYANIGYTITVNGGTADKSEAIYGASVTITANAPGENEIFIGWTIEGKDGLDTTQTILTFNMPANAVTATANYKKYYKVTVENGNASVDGSVVEKAFENETVTITAIVNEGERFIKWEIVAGSVELGSDAEATTTFKMPAENVTIKAIVQKVAPTPFPVGSLVYNGTEQTGVEEREGYTIKNGTAVDAGTYYATATLKDGYVWEDGKNDKERLVEWWIKKATRNAPTGLESEKASSVTAKDGKIKNTTTEMLYRKRGLADWEKVIGTEITGLSIGVYEVKFDESKNYNESDVAEIRVVAECNIVVTGGSGAGTYNTGDVATVKADAPAKGKVFAGWKDANGNIVSTDSNYTFTVMDGISLTAVYVDAPAEKNTLSGGQIAGIVIGSLAGVGIVGFAIFWFVVKKKSFADLISAIKETVNKVLKKGNKEE